MAAFLIIILLPLVGSIPQTPCNRINIGDKYYEKEILWSDVGRPYNLNVHKSSNTLFFSYSTPETYSDSDFQIAFYNLDTKESQAVLGIKGGCTTAIDYTTDEIYMGGSDGLYKFNMATKIADFYKEGGQNIWAVFHRTNLFYISYPDQKLHIEVDGRFAKVKEFERFETDNFFITSTNDIYFANKTGLYTFDNIHSDIIAISELFVVRQIVEDNQGNLYVCTNVGVLMDQKYDGFKKIIDFKNIYGLAFDRDNNFIISDERSIIRLKPSLLKCGDSEEYW